MALTAIHLLVSMCDNDRGLAYVVNDGQSERRGVARRLDPAALLREPHVLRRPVHMRYLGLWRVRESGVHEISLQSKGEASLILDGDPVIERSSDATTRRSWQRIRLDAGLHRVAIEYAPGTRPFKLLLLVARPGEPQRPVSERDLFVNRPGRFSDILDWIRVVLAYLSALAWLLALTLVYQAIGPRARRLFPVLILIYGGILRFEALVGRYWLDDAPPGAHRLEALASYLRPHTVQWAPDPHPYDGDAAGYLHYARNMRRFYEGSGREPVFVFTTRAFLPLANPENMAVNFASCFFSTAAVGATYLLASAAFGPAAGLVASFAIAIERQAVGLAADGWRDDAFACMVALAAWALLRLRARPNGRGAVIAGVMGASAMLTRITAVSFLAPALLWIGFSGTRRERRDRLVCVAIASGTLLLLVAPYLAACWRTFGDPLIAINTHASFYHDREGLTGESPASWDEYVIGERRVLDRLETLAVGLTIYPFENKWRGFEDWSPFAGHALRIVAVCGLACAFVFPSGRLLMLILTTALIPFAFTWNIRGGSEWRFTLFAYPFYLSAVGLIAATAVRFGAALRRRDLGRMARRHRRDAIYGVAAAVFLAILTTLLLPGIAYLRAIDALRAGMPLEVDVESEPRGRFFLASGWGENRIVSGKVVRISQGRVAILRAPFTPGADHRLALTVGLPAHGDAAIAEVRSGDRLLDRLELRGDARLSTHDIRVPASAVRRLSTLIELRLLGKRDSFTFRRMHIEPLRATDRHNEKSW
ncbi:MAG: glycosyltransferase family 39 protein [Vicinamibacteria bacterium]|nr:glycosyltransferase family 39 protein [Vicinamibacteria bacterium]